MAVTLAELLNRMTQVPRNLIRRCLIDGDLLPRQVIKKVRGAPAVIVNDD
jgi:hypothetical protein